MAKATLLDIAKLNGNDAAVGLVEENLKFAPERGIVPRPHYFRHVLPHCDADWTSLRRVPLCKRWIRPD